jgi:hypothetical protein
MFRKDGELSKPVTIETLRVTSIADSAKRLDEQSKRAPALQLIVNRVRPILKEIRKTEARGRVIPMPRREDAFDDGDL